MNRNVKRFAKALNALPASLATFVVLVISWQPDSGLAQSTSLRCVESAEAISVLDGEREILRYNIVAPAAPDKERSVYQRSGYIHPIRSPRGAIVSGDFAPDHPHQHGLFLAWTKTHFRGQLIDFWNQHRASGIVLHDRVIATRQPSPKDPTARFRVAVRHCRRSNDGQLKKILDDVWSVSVMTISDETSAPAYQIRLESVQTNVTDHPLTIDEYHYGGFGFRGRNGWFTKDAAVALSWYAKQDLPRKLPSWSEVPHRLRTDENDDRIAANHSKPQEVTLSGLVSSKGDEPSRLAGIRIRSGSNEAATLPPVRLHPTKPYFSVSPCVSGAFDIESGKSIQMDFVMEVFDEVVSEAD